jgi:hypothetical protein
MVIASTGFRRHVLDSSALEPAAKPAARRPFGREYLPMINDSA